jgi:predicted dehydrogenase
MTGSMLISDDKANVILQSDLLTVVMRVGIAGYGVVGKTRHTSIIKNTTFKVTAISEKNLEAQKAIPSGIEIFDSYQDLISKD